MTDITLIPQKHKINTCTHKVTSVSGIILRQLRPQRPWLSSCRGPNSYPHVCLQTQAWRTAQQKTAPSDWMDGDVRSTPTEVFRGVEHTPSEVFRGVCPSWPSSEVLRSRDMAVFCPGAVLCVQAYWYNVRNDSLSLIQYILK